MVALCVQPHQRIFEAYMQCTAHSAASRLIATEQVGGRRTMSGCGFAGYRGVTVWSSGNSVVVIAGSVGNQRRQDRALGGLSDCSWLLQVVGNFALLDNYHLLQRVAGRCGGYGDWCWSGLSSERRDALDVLAIATLTDAAKHTCSLCLVSFVCSSHVLIHVRCCRLLQRRDDFCCVDPRCLRVALAHSPLSLRCAPSRRAPHCACARAPP